MQLPLPVCVLVWLKVIVGVLSQLSVAVGLAGAGTASLWIRCYRRYTAGRAFYDSTGMVKLRCPECGYSMVGLKVARCPECGREYTLDELVCRQDFDIRRVYLEKDDS